MTNNLPTYVLMLQIICQSIIWFSFVKVLELFVNNDNFSIICVKTKNGNIKRDIKVKLFKF